MLLSTLSILQAQDNIIDEVIWVVGDQAILKSEVEEQRLEALYRNEKIDGDPYCVIPEQIAIQKLFLNQAKIDSIEVPEAQVTQYVEAQINYYTSQIGSKEKMEEYFRKPTVKIRETLRETVRDNLIVQSMQEKIIGEIKITPTEVRKYYSKLPADSIPFIPTQVEVQVVTIEPKPTLQEIDRVKARLREFTEQINSGEFDFSTLAILYSQDTESAKRGGELGFMGKAQLVPKFANVAFGLQSTSRVSQIVETEYGFHIIQLIERQGDKANFRHILLKPEIEAKEIEEGINRLDSIRADIVEGKFTFEEAALFISHDKDSRNNNGLMMNPYTGTLRFEMQELPQEIAKVVDKMEPGEISQAITVLSPQQKPVCMLVKLRNRYPGHKANVSADYQELKDVVRSAKAKDVIKAWIEEKQKTTYIRINPNWANCEFEYPGWIKE
ncbi:MAG: peptidylprolyl isomerase [Candidatus Azobacteroides sp.]|nr:peptidylprolyl isomerase [Candidatus Azobacteroides sp.]